MFKQFIKDINGDQVYLIISLAMFMMFFLTVAFLLIRIKKNHTNYMSDLPLADSITQPENQLL
ncbi:hypothetical protein DJ568_05980 [Mucilaginibacter hurinus]|uniref:CcoQ/FixQ family Cbb3-type cytochrome c oxidase assembly chaperone n=1 Tax=Mucilaginibacter hurinus TaxID=2201324 RepID=A0A367GRU7_9SPHI|nr:hypothetical protein [Mucilaginibacter hurinus]RCH55441.1 hypothetical protein DJ568_05980 [Mucilaginibacter hurinus]